MAMTGEVEMYSFAVEHDDDGCGKSSLLISSSARIHARHFEHLCLLPWSFREGSNKSIKMPSWKIVVLWKTGSGEDCKVMVNVNS